MRITASTRLHVADVSNLKLHKHRANACFHQPVLTQRVEAKRIKMERLVSASLEASEQCERLTVPEVSLLKLRY